MKQIPVVEVQTLQRECFNMPAAIHTCQSDRKSAEQAASKSVGQVALWDV